MAKQMQYRDDRIGVKYEESYWYIVECNLNKFSRTGRIIFNGYSNKQDRDKLDTHTKRAAQALMIGTREYVVTRELYDKYFGPAQLCKEHVDQWTQSYKLAEKYLDVKNPFFTAPDDMANYDAVIQELEKDPETCFVNGGVAMYLSFFNKATDV